MRPIIDNGPGGPTASLYVHLPFCRERCLYCSFPTVADDPAAHGPLIDTLLSEARGHADRGAVLAPLETLYLGGGTPGLIAPALLERLLSGLAALWPFQDDVEMTIEVNPANVCVDALAAWAALGVNRLSLGVQSFHDDVLARLGRRHDAARAEAALRDIQHGWRHTWSADLLAGWAGQTVALLEADLTRLVAAAPQHVSIYALTVEAGTPLAAQQRAGRQVTAGAALEPALDARCAQLLGQAGFERYEVSNYARPGHRSRHNQVYWADASYLGLGPGAASSVHPHRWVNRADLPGYLASATTNRPLRVSAELVAPESRLVEVLGVGLRTRDGLDSQALDQRFGGGVASALADAGEALAAAGLLEFHAGRIRIPESSLSRADAIVSELIVHLSPGAAVPTPSVV